MHSSSGPTVIQKLFAAFTVTYILIAILVGSYLWNASQSKAMLDRVQHELNKKLEISSGIELATTEMQGAQRGLMLSYEAKDAASAQPYIDSYAASAKSISSLLDELDPLAQESSERESLQHIRESLNEWKPRFDQLANLCKGGEIEAAYKLRNQNKQLSATMHASASQLAKVQKVSLQQADMATQEAVQQARWLGMGLAALSLVMGAIVMMQIRGMSRTLLDVVSQLTIGSDEIASAAAQVSNTSQSLAQGATEQAAGLEETSASSQELGSMSRQNTEKSTKMLELVTTSQLEFAATNQELSETVRAMEEIRECTNKISKILHVIEGIAFQTNILALNAAVEAARAGQYGMGFAVVAEEVRSLANQSAQAAKDTAVLIGDAIQKTGEGNAKMTLMASSISRLSEGSIAIKKLVDELSAGSKEQNLGTEQIGRALLDMEKVTQSAAASAEEGAAASEELRAQADILRQITSQMEAMIGSSTMPPQAGMRRIGPKQTSQELAYKPF